MELEVAALMIAVVVAMVLAAGFIAYRESIRKRVWVIRIRLGVPTQIKGKIAQPVVAELVHVLKRNGVRNGAIFGIRRRGTITLGFSTSIPPSCRQGLRNVWTMHSR